jgi:ketosteroid isomerase-like protein
LSSVGFGALVLMHRIQASVVEREQVGKPYNQVVKSIYMPLQATKIPLSGLLLIGLMPVLAQAQNSADKVSEVRTEWIRTFNAKNLTGVVALYSDDAVILPPTGERIAGKPDITAYFKRLFNSPASLNIQLNSKNTDSSVELAYDSGTYEETSRTGAGVSQLLLTGAGGPDIQTKQEGNYLWVLKSQANKLLIVQQASTEKSLTSQHSTK